MELVKAVVELVNAVISSVNDSNEKKKSGQQTERYLQAEAITIEKRTKDKTITVITIPLPVYKSLTDAELKQLIG